MFFFILSGLRRVMRMSDSVELDYRLAGDYAVYSNTQNSMQNILMNKTVADLIVHHGATITCACGHVMVPKIYGTNLSAHFNAHCPNVLCKYHSIPKLKKIYHYHPLGLALVYETLKNDSGYTGNIHKQINE